MTSEQLDKAIILRKNSEVAGDAMVAIVKARTSIDEDDDVNHVIKMNSSGNVVHGLITYMDCPELFNDILEAMEKATEDYLTKNSEKFDKL